MTEKKQNIYKEVEGHFLVARLNVRGIFSHSVVWLFDFSKEEGANGIIINRPTSMTVGQCLSNYSGSALGGIPVFEGGPVGDHNIRFVLRSRDFFTGDTSVKYGISAEELCEQVSAPGVRAYGFAGHAVWAPGQLEFELSRNLWLCSRMDAAAWDKGGGRALWQRLVEKAGGTDAELMLRAPEDITQN